MAWYVAGSIAPFSQIRVKNRASTQKAAVGGAIGTMLRSKMSHVFMLAVGRYAHHVSSYPKELLAAITISGGGRACGTDSLGREIVHACAFQFKYIDGNTVRTQAEKAVCCRYVVCFWKRAAPRWRQGIRLCLCTEIIWRCQQPLAAVPLTGLAMGGGSLEGKALRHGRQRGGGAWLQDRQRVTAPAIVQR